MEKRLNGNCLSEEERSLETAISGKAWEGRLFE
jgi:hypothetical protein